MTGNPVGLVEFLQQRLDELEAMARSSVCPCGGPVCTPELGWYHRSELEERFSDSRHGLDHIEQWSPNFVLQDIAAKRRIIEHVRPVAEDDLEYSGWQDFAGGVLKFLAAPFSSHPDSEDSRSEPAAPATATATPHRAAKENTDERKRDADPTLPLVPTADGAHQGLVVLPIGAAT